MSYRLRLHLYDLLGIIQKVELIVWLLGREACPRGYQPPGSTWDTASLNLLSLSDLFLTDVYIKRAVYKKGAILRELKRPCMMSSNPDFHIACPSGYFSSPNCKTLTTFNRILTEKNTPNNNNPKKAVWHLKVRGYPTSLPLNTSRAKPQKGFYTYSMYTI